MSEAHELTLAIRGRIHAAARPESPPTPGLSIFGVGQSDVMRGLAELERRTRTSVWSIQPRLSFDPENPAFELEDRSRARGVHMQTITPRRVLRLNPLLTSLAPNIRIGPALLTCTIVDRRVAIIEGPETIDGDTTAWSATSGPFLRDALDLWEATFAESTPALADGTPPPLNGRQVAVARSVCLGRTDATIARQLSISDRTVARDVAVILELTSARSRSEAILNMLGRGRHSRT